MSAADSLQSKLSEAGYADLEISDLINYSLVSALPAMPKAMLRMHNEIIASLKPGLGWTFSRSVCTRLREYGRVVDTRHRLADRTLSSPPLSALLTQGQVDSLRQYYTVCAYTQVAPDDSQAAQ
jgi:hypothetical protein